MFRKKELKNMKLVFLNWSWKTSNLESKTKLKTVDSSEKKQNTDQEDPYYIF
jgi:hypothetical protein